MVAVVSMILEWLNKVTSTTAQGIIESKSKQYNIA